MKKINSNDYGYKVIGIGLVFAIIIPIIIKLLYFLFRYEVLNTLMWCSVGIGSVILIGFFIYLGIELQQDKRLDQYYNDHRYSKIQIEHSNFECASCGNRNVRKQDKSCAICGVLFKES